MVKKQTVETLAIIQARMSSTRLPGKVMMKLEKKPILEHVVSRVSRARGIDEVVVATTINLADLPIVEFCAQNGIRVFCGSEENVLDRFFQVAKLIKPRNIVRITADCPMIDHREIARVVAVHARGGYDYTANSISGKCADGEDVEIFKFSALEESWKRAKLASDLEHVTLYIKRFPKKFKLRDTPGPLDLSNERWTVDRKEDLQFARATFGKLYKKDSFFGIRDVLRLLEENPKMGMINNHIVRNEGLKKSLAEEAIGNKQQR